MITELVLAHTSDEHPWFARARRAAPGSVERDFYTWSDTPERFGDARVIFQDFETSNWAWDATTKEYYWHRFYSHQPALNYDNPAVRAEMFAVVDYWLEMGVDGLRLDAVPYLYAREGTTSENLPETIDFLRQLRRHVDDRFPGRMLLAEANQWPEDAAAYLGDGDVCHMAFHFPLMPRMFMAARQEDRFPIVDILTETPPIPDDAQWALFLRNHDELTLEMVTDEERDYMYRVYAEDPQARINVGIRRRLAPLLGNDRKLIEMMNGLMFSLPGTPIVYYGDEIGMGDNIYLGDRNSVRTPMQWDGDRNAGFSDANPQQLYLPVVIDPEYHMQSVNVAAQQENSSSLLWWMRRLVALRNHYRAFARGTFELLRPDNRKVLAFIRRLGDETILVAVNLSRFAQAAELDLSDHLGAVPVELFGGSEFPPVGDLPYFVTLGPHGFYWFSLEHRHQEARLHVPFTVAGAVDVGLLPPAAAARELLLAADLPEPAVVPGEEPSDSRGRDRRGDPGRSCRGRQRALRLAVGRRALRPRRTGTVRVAAHLPRRRPRSRDRAPPRRRGRRRAGRRRRGGDPRRRDGRAQLRPRRDRFRRPSPATPGRGRAARRAPDTGVPCRHRVARPDPSVVALGGRPVEHLARGRQCGRREAAPSGRGGRSTPTSRSVAT